MRVGALPRDRAYRRDRMRQRRLFSGPLPPARTSLPNVLRLSAEGQKRRFRCGLNNSEIVGSVGKPPLNVRPLFGTASSTENGWHGREAAGRRSTFEMETVERGCISAAAPDPSSDERAAPSHTMIGSGVALFERGCKSIQQIVNFRGCLNGQSRIPQHQAPVSGFQLWDPLCQASSRAFRPSGQRDSLWAGVDAGYAELATKLPHPKELQEIPRRLGNGPEAVFELLRKTAEGFASGGSRQTHVKVEPKLRVRHVVVRNKPAGAEIHLGRELRLGSFAACYSEGAVQEVLVELASDQFQVSRLLEPEQVTGAADVQVRAADLEARAESVERLEGLQSL